MKKFTVQLLAQSVTHNPQQFSSRGAALRHAKTLWAFGPYDVLVNGRVKFTGCED